MASVFLADLDGDWIAPSQACTNPLFADDTPAASPFKVAAVEGRSKAKVQLSMELDPSQLSASVAVKPDLIRTIDSGFGGKKKAAVSLNDCLACSGCVTR